MQHILEFKMMESSLKTWFMARKSVSGINPLEKLTFSTFHKGKS